MVDDAARKAAVKRLKAKKDFYSYLAVFVFVNVVSLIVWAALDFDFFWPGWVLFGTGIALFWSAWAAFGVRKEITEAEIQREMGKDSGSGPAT